MLPRNPTLVVPSSCTNFNKPYVWFKINSNSLAISSIDSVLNRIETTTKQMENNLNVNILNGVANNDENEKNDKQIKTLEILNQEPNVYQKIFFKVMSNQRFHRILILSLKTPWLFLTTKRENVFSSNIDQVPESRK